MRERCCQAPGCVKKDQGGGRCIAHGGGKRCQTEGCSKSAQGDTSYCIVHGGGKRCQTEGCSKSAIGATNYCKAHGGGKRCLTEGCSKSAVDATNYCKAHGGGKRCLIQGCSKSARGVGVTGYCIAHGGGKRCQTEECSKSAQGVADYCVAHGGGTRCALCNQFWVRYQGFHCYGCRKGTQRVKQLECMVKDYLDEDQNLQHYTYYDQTLPCAPNLRRPDFTYLLSDRIVILEVDEDAHRYYNQECETRRITELMEQVGGKPLILLRFNPLKSLLGEMKTTLKHMFFQPLTGLLYVEFLGYEQDYDVIAEITRLASNKK